MTITKKSCLCLKHVCADLLHFLNTSHDIPRVLILWINYVTEICSRKYANFEWQSMNIFSRALKNVLHKSHFPFNCIRLVTEVIYQCKVPMTEQIMCCHMKLQREVKGCLSYISMWTSSGFNVMNIWYVIAKCTVSQLCKRKCTASRTLPQCEYYTATHQLLIIFTTIDNFQLSPRSEQSWDERKHRSPAVY